MTETTKIYYELHVRDLGSDDFHVDFGDYDREVVEQELEDRIGDILYGDEINVFDRESRKSDYKIIRVEESPTMDVTVVDRQIEEIVNDSYKQKLGKKQVGTVSMLDGGRENTGTVLKFRFNTMGMFNQAGRTEDAQKVLNHMWDIFTALDKADCQIGMPVKKCKFVYPGVGDVCDDVESNHDASLAHSPTIRTHAFQLESDRCECPENENHPGECDRFGSVRNSECFCH